MYEIKLFKILMSIWYNLQPSDLCVTAGWGFPTNGDVNLELRMFLPVPTYNSKECNATSHYAGFITENSICAGFKDKDKGPCYVSWKQINLWIKYERKLKRIVQIDNDFSERRRSAFDVLQQVKQMGNTRITKSSQQMF